MGTVNTFRYKLYNKECIGTLNALDTYIYLYVAKKTDLWVL